MKLMILVLSTEILASCGGAADGDAATDTTSMPVDTAHMSDSIDHINRADGTVPVDTTLGDTLLPQR